MKKNISIVIGVLTLALVGQGFGYSGYIKEIMRMILGVNHTLSLATLKPASPGEIFHRRG